MVVPSTSAAIAAALGTNLEDVGPELTPAETATSASSTAGSSSSEEESESEDDVIKMEEGSDVIRNGEVSKGDAITEEQEVPRRKSEGQDPMEPHAKKSKASAPHLIKRSKSVPGGLSRQVCDICMF